VIFWLDFQHQSLWTVCDFDMEEHVGRATIIDVRSDSDSSPSPP